MSLARDAAGQWRRAADGDHTAIAFIREKFPAAADLLHTPDRRQFMRLMAASLALSGLAGCDDDPRDEIVPPVNQAEGAVPGSVLTYASSVLVDGFANGVLVKTRDGRPIKIEGNPDHPWSRGGTDVFGQASVLGLYDPFRSQSVQFDTRDSDWPAFRAAIAGPLAQWRSNGGQGFALLVGPTTSPSLAAQLAALQRAWPRMRIYTHVPATRAALYEGTRRAFGQPLETHWRLSGARVIVSLDGDLLDAGPHQVGAAREWSDARQAAAGAGGLLRMWAAGPVPNLTSAKADYPFGCLACAGVGDGALAAVPRAGFEPTTASARSPALVRCCLARAGRRAGSRRGRCRLARRCGRASGSTVAERRSGQYG